jgi:hypothetical protein
LPDNYQDGKATRYNICQTSLIDAHQTEGFIHSPNYPLSYPRRNYCQMKIKFNGVNNERLEVFLIDLQIEKPSLFTANPTDYLQVNNDRKYFGDYKYDTLVNDTHDVFLTFKSDTFFTKRGFLIYFRGKLILLYYDGLANGVSNSWFHMRIIFIDTGLVPNNRTVLIHFVFCLNQFLFWVFLSLLKTML